MNVVVSGFSKVCYVVVTAVCNTMCMYTLPGEDVFAGSEWECDEVPLGPLDISCLNLQFQDNGKVKIELLSESAEDLMIIAGEYLHNDGAAIFDPIIVMVDSFQVTFIEADWANDQTLFLLWRVADILHPFTTPLNRVN